MQRFPRFGFNCFPAHISQSTPVSHLSHTQGRSVGVALHCEERFGKAFLRELVHQGRTFQNLQTVFGVQFVWPYKAQENAYCIIAYTLAYSHIAYLHIAHICISHIHIWHICILYNIVAYSNIAYCGILSLKDCASGKMKNCNHVCCRVSERVCVCVCDMVLRPVKVSRGLEFACCGSAPCQAGRSLPLTSQNLFNLLLRRLFHSSKLVAGLEDPLKNSSSVLVLGPRCQCCPPEKYKPVFCDPLDVPPRKRVIPVALANELSRGTENMFKKHFPSCLLSVNYTDNLDAIHGALRATDTFLTKLLQEMQSYLLGPVGEPAHMSRVNDLMLICPFLTIWRTHLRTQ